MGTIPGPIFFGYIIDQVCLLKDGNCLFYDNYSMAVSMGIAFSSFFNFIYLIMDNLHTGQLSRHFFFWQATILRLTQITP